MNESILENDILEWDVRNWSTALQFWESNSSQNLSSLHALEIGARNGGLSLWLALKGFNVLCTDINGPSEIAFEKHKYYGVSGLISYESLDVLDISYKERFDVIIFKSVLGGIGHEDHPEKQIKAIVNIYNALKPGGELLFVENLVGSPLHMFFRKHFVRWGKRWRYVTIYEIVEFTSLFKDFTYQANGFLGAFGQTEPARNFLGKIDQVLFDKIIPPNWRYIISGVARK